ncbi:MAG: XdhC family protein [Burkholderiaceae bacterium]|nr:XdhC family protein [Burkholderiaceae bacterium]
MDSIDREVLERTLEWVNGGHRVGLVTVIETWGSAPRPPGALLAVRDDGLVVGSVSGGCVEDDLIARVRRSGQPEAATLVSYGVTREEAARFGLPCGGALKLVHEPVRDAGWIVSLLERISRHQLVTRELELASGKVSLHPAARGDALRFDGERMCSVFGPRYRLLVIGAGQLSRVLAQMAQALDFEVFVCDPRVEYFSTLDLPDVGYLPGMPDDVVRELKADAHTAIVALTHDPKLDDMALIEALDSPAFYVGALGSRANNTKRRERLALFELSDAQIARLHGPIGLHIGSRTPAEIAVSILAEIVSVRNGVAPTQKKASERAAAARSVPALPVGSTAGA